MGRHTIQKFTCGGHQIEVVRDRSNIPATAPFEARLGIRVRYGLKFDGQLTDWTDFVEATEDELSARRMVGLGLRRALELSEQDGTDEAFSAA